MLKYALSAPGQSLLVDGKPAEVVETPVYSV
jgi:hypothetical protein